MAILPFWDKPTEPLQARAPTACGTWRTQLNERLVAEYTPVRIIANMRNGAIISELMKDGWYEVARKGSHVQFKHATKAGRVTIPHPKKDIPVGTLKSIEKQSGLKLR
jgi:predicted RNA binding protein YcfA (HicA-like mRNA interferase family)